MYNIWRCCFLALCFGVTVAISSVTSPASSLARMGPNGERTHIQGSKLVAPTIALLKKCGRGDLARRWFVILEKNLDVCEATAAQRNNIKKAYNQKYHFSDCSLINKGVNAINKLILEQEQLVKNYIIIKKATQRFNCN
ncbi:MAG TPA: hypothetical protein VI522_01555 [Gammaproteobacteria bacterium]|nr:hypothetical protein [Gammaproteobacteria bacterium]